VAFGADRTVKVNVKANVSDYIGKITAASKATRDFSRDAVKSAQAHRQSWDKVGKGMLVAGGVLAAGVGLAIKSYADFDQKLSTVRAVSGATAGEMDKLSAAALKAGADTKFSASQAAEAEGELAKLGVSTADILGGALRGSLDLAAAGNLNLADAATYAGQAMKIFNLAGKDVPHVADVLAAGANKSAADVQTLAQALQQGGLVAAQTGLTLEDTVGVLSAFSDNALNGSDAGTSFKTMLQRLNPQSEAAANLMDQLGLRAYDAQGNFVGITEYAGKLRKALGGMSAEQRNATMQTIFGSDAVRAANVLYKEGADGIAQYVKGVNDQGAAARVAAIQMDNLKGDIEQLRGSIETGLIQAGSGANGVLRDLVQTATGAVNTFGALPKPVQQGALAVAAVAAAALLAGGAFLTLVPRIAATRVAMAELGITSARTSALLKAAGSAGIVLGIAAVAAEIGSAAAKASVADVEVEKLAGSLEAVANGSKDAGALGDLFDTGRGPFRHEVTSTTEAINAFADSVKGAFGQDLSDKIGRLGSFRVETVTKQIGELDAAMAQMVKNGNADEAAQTYDRLFAAIDAANKKGAQIPVDEIASKFTQYQGALDATTTAQQTTGASAQEFAGIVDGVAITAEDAGKAIDGLIKALVDAGLVQLSARDAARNFLQALDDVDESIKKNGRTLDIHTQKGRDNQTALDNVAKSAIDQAQAIYESTKATKGEGPAQDAFRASLLKSRDGLIKTAEKFGLSRSEAKKFADQLLQIPPKRETKVVLTGAEAATAKAKALRDALLGIKSRRVTVDVITRTANKLGSQAGLDPTRQAEGGYIAGPGTATSDSIPAYLSNGEYVVKAAAVNKYGASFFDRLNSMRFASGGLVGAGAVSVGSPEVAVYVQSPIDGTWVRSQARVVVKSELGSQARSLASGRR
jgi:TP901 family phage tail tape measure protein